jgi:hypothetical protein
MNGKTALGQSEKSRIVHNTTGPHSTAETFADGPHCRQVTASRQTRAGTADSGRRRRHSRQHLAPDHSLLSRQLRSARCRAVAISSAMRSAISRVRRGGVTGRSISPQRCVYWIMTSWSRNGRFRKFHSAVGGRGHSAPRDGGWPPCMRPTISIATASVGVRVRQGRAALIFRPLPRTLAFAICAVHTR